MPANLILSAAAAATLAAAAGQDSEKAVEASISCREISDDSLRLACLDEAAEVLAVTRILRVQEEEKKDREEKSWFGLRRNDGSQADPLTAPVADTPENFGSEDLPELRREKEAKRLKAITAQITEIRLNQFNTATIELGNGQVWRQLDSDSRKLLFAGKDRQYTAEITRSALGSYDLKINELKKTIRVRRIK